jgi:hypothetical protein
MQTPHIYDDIVVPSRIAPQPDRMENDQKSTYETCRCQQERHKQLSLKKEVCFSLQIWVTAFLVSEHRSGA